MKSSQASILLIGLIFLSFKAQKNPFQVIEMLKEKNDLDKNNYVQINENMGQIQNDKKLTVFGWMKINTFQKTLNPLIKLSFANNTGSYYENFENFVLANYNYESKKLQISYLNKVFKRDLQSFDLILYEDIWFFISLGFDFKEKLFQIFTSQQNEQFEAIVWRILKIQLNFNLPQNFQLNLGCFPKYGNQPESVQNECTEGQVQNFSYLNNYLDNPSLFFMLDTNKLEINNFLFDGEDQNFQIVFPKGKKTESLILQGPKNYEKIGSSQIQIFNGSNQLNLNGLILTDSRISLKSTFTLYTKMSFKNLNDTIIFGRLYFSNGQNLMIEIKKGNLDKYFLNFTIKEIDFNFSTSDFLRNNHVSEFTITFVREKHLFWIIFNDSNQKYSSYKISFSKILSTDFQILDSILNNPNTLFKFYRLSLTNQSSGAAINFITKNSEFKKCRLQLGVSKTENRCLSCKHDYVFIAEKSVCQRFCPFGFQNIYGLCYDCKGDNCQNLTEKFFEIKQVSPGIFQAILINPIYKQNVNFDELFFYDVEGKDYQKDYVLNKEVISQKPYTIQYKFIFQNPNENQKIQFTLRNEKIYSISRNAIPRQVVTFQSQQDSENPLSEDFIYERNQQIDFNLLKILKKPINSYPGTNSDQITSLDKQLNDQIEKANQYVQNQNEKQFRDYQFDGQGILILQVPQKNKLEDKLSEEQNQNPLPIYQTQSQTKKFDGVIEKKQEPLLQTKQDIFKFDENGILLDQSNRPYSDIYDNSYGIFDSQQKKIYDRIYLEKNKFNYNDFIPLKTSINQNLRRKPSVMNQKKIFDSQQYQQTENSLPFYLNRNPYQSSQFIQKQDQLPKISQKTDPLEYKFQNERRYFYPIQNRLKINEKPELINYDHWQNAQNIFYPQINSLQNFLTNDIKKQQQQKQNDMFLYPVEQNLNTNQELMQDFPLLEQSQSSEKLNQISYKRKGLNILKEHDQIRENLQELKHKFKNYRNYQNIEEKDQNEINILEKYRRQQLLNNLFSKYYEKQKNNDLQNQLIYSKKPLTQNFIQKDNQAINQNQQEKKNFSENYLNDLIKTAFQKRTVQVEQDKNFFDQFIKEKNKQQVKGVQEQDIESLFGSIAEEIEIQPTPFHNVQRKNTIYAFAIVVYILFLIGVLFGILKLFLNIYNKQNYSNISFLKLTQLFLLMQIFSFWTFYYNHYPKQLKQFLNDLRKLFLGNQIIWNIDNHDHRIHSQYHHSHNGTYDLLENHDNLRRHNVSNLFLQNFSLIILMQIVFIIGYIILNFISKKQQKRAMDNYVQDGNYNLSGGSYRLALFQKEFRKKIFPMLFLAFGFEIGAFTIYNLVYVKKWSGIHLVSFLLVFVILIIFFYQAFKQKKKSIFNQQNLIKKNETYYRTNNNSLESESILVQIYGLFFFTLGFLTVLLQEINDVLLIMQLIIVIILFVISVERNFEKFYFGIEQRLMSGTLSILAILQVIVVKYKQVAWVQYIIIILIILLIFESVILLIFDFFINEHRVINDFEIIDEQPKNEIEQLKELKIKKGKESEKNNYTQLEEFKTISDQIYLDYQFNYVLF